MSEPLDSNVSQAAPTIPSRAQDFWERYFKFYDTLNNSIPYRRMIERHGELLQAAEGDLILDAGTGSGNVAVDLVSRKARVIGTDFCEPALEICRRKVPEAQFQFGDLSKVQPFESNSFAKIACSCVLHVLDAEAQRTAVHEFFRILKPSGRLAITSFTTGFNPIKVYIETLRERRRIGGLGETLWFGLQHGINTVKIFYYVAQIQKGNRKGKHNFLSRDAMQRLLEGAGFKVESIESTFAGQCVTALATKPA